MKKSDIAKALGVSRQTVYDWESQGVLEEKIKGIDITEIMKEPKKDDDKEHARFIKELAKKFPDTPIIRGTDLPEVEFISTGLPRLDKVLGGGVAKGRIFYAWGRSAVGKTTLSLILAREFMKIGRVAYLDSEHAVNDKYAHALGVDMEKLEFLTPVYLDECINLVRNMTETGLYSLIILDSVAASRYRPEKDGESGQADMGWRGKIMNQAMRMIKASAYKTGTTILFINQQRDVMNKMSRAEVKYQPGGVPIEYAASQMVELRSKSNALATSKKGRNIQIALLKSNVSSPFQSDIFRLEHGKGFIDEWNEEYNKDNDETSN